MSRLAKILRARSEAAYSVAIYTSTGTDHTDRRELASTRQVGEDGQQQGQKRSRDSGDVFDEDPVELAKYAVRLMARCFEVYADAGTSFSVEQKVQTDFQIGQTLLELCDYNEQVLESILPWVWRTFRWRYWGRASQINGPRRVGKTFGTAAVKTAAASVCRNLKAAFVNLYSESGGQIIEYVRNFHRILQNDPRKRIDTIWLKIHNKYHIRIQSHLQRRQMREMGVELPDPKRLRTTLTTQNEQFCQISSLPNRAQQAGATEGRTRTVTRTTIPLSRHPDLSIGTHESIRKVSWCPAEHIHMDLLDPEPKEPVKEKISLAKRLGPAKRKGAPTQEEDESLEEPSPTAPTATAGPPATVAKSGFAKRRRVGPPAEPGAGVPVAQSKPSHDTGEVDNPAPAIAKDDVPNPATVMVPEPSPITPMATPAPMDVVETSIPTTPTLRQSVVIDATAQPVEDLPDATAAMKQMSAEAARKFLPTHDLCDEYAMLLIHCMMLAQAPESLTRKQIDKILEKAEAEPVWTLTKQSRTWSGSPAERSFGFTWYTTHRESPKNIEQLSVVSSDCALRILARSESIPVDVEHSNDILTPFVVAWWRTFARASSPGTLVEPMCIILGGSHTQQPGHFSTLITRDGIRYQHHNSFPMGTVDTFMSDPSDQLARDWLASAQKIVAELTLSHEPTRARLRELNIPYIKNILEPLNRPALEALMMKTRFFVTYDLDRKRHGSAQIPHESLLQRPESGDCLLHCIERIAFCIADGGNHVSCTGGPSLQERAATVKRMRACCVLWWKLKWESMSKGAGN